MERAFSADFSVVRVHTGPESDRVASGLGARALTTGRDILFRSGAFRPYTPSGERLLAHELAHVVQQAGGLPRAALDGGAADPLEKAAETAADRAVTSGLAAGQAAAPSGQERGWRAATPAQAAPARADAPGRHVVLAGSEVPPVSPGRESLACELSHVVQPSSGASAIRRAPAIQRQTADPGSQAPTSAHDPSAPPSRNATWEQILEAAYSKQAQERLDIAWIEDLPAPLKESIDGAFADSAAQAAYENARKKDPDLKEIDRQYELDRQAARAKARERLAAADPTITRKKGALDKALAKDQDFSAEEFVLLAKHQLKVLAREAQLAKANYDLETKPAKRGESVAELPPEIKSSSRLKEVAFQRTNFMSWAIDVLGSPAAAKQHFRHIRKVAHTNAMFLSDDAATRFEDARSDFEKAHPGYTFPESYSAFTLRGFHQSRQPIGQLGHALGLAFDLFAYANPNQKLPKGDPRRNYHYLLEKFGGTAGQKGRSFMELGKQGEATIAQLGKDTAQQRMTPEEAAIVEKIGTQFNEMVATSKRFQASIEAQLPLLSEARDLYFNAKEAEKHPVTSADSPTPEQMRAQVSEMLKEAFAEWIAAIDAEADSDKEIAQAKEDLEAIAANQPGAVDKLDDYADQHALARLAPAGTAQAYKEYLRKRLVEKYSPFNENAEQPPDWLRNEAAVLPRWQEGLLDPAFVFGEGVVPKGDTSQPKHWKTKLESEDVPLMQLIEGGFVEQDDLSSGRKHEVFGVEVVTTLARYGFSPGAAYPVTTDTMHFDFIEGYEAVPGGRSQSNMQENKYGPRGDPTPAAPRPAQKKPN
jgi:Domain of unknown function (DUF4157)